MIDAGQSTTFDEVYEHIEAGDTIAWLSHLVGQFEKELGLLQLIAEDPESADAVQDILERHSNAAEPGDFAVSRNGLCLLLGYCLNEMQGLLE